MGNRTISARTANVSLWVTMHYESLEVDEFWTFVGNKKNKHWLIYAYHRETGEIVAYVWGKRDL